MTDQPAEASTVSKTRDRLAALLHNVAVYAEPGLQTTFIVPKLTAAKAAALADEIEAGRAAVAALARVKTLLTDNRLVERVDGVLIYKIGRDDLRAALDGTGDGGERHG